MKLDNIEFNDLVAVDDAAIVSQWDDNNIITESKISCEIEEDEEIGELPPNVTNKQALSAMDTLRKYVERQPNVSEDTYKSLEK